MPNQWTGVGNPYTRQEVLYRLRDTISRGKAIIAAGAGTGISAKFIERGGADLIIIYNSGRYRMMNPEECAELGRILAEKVNASTGLVRVFDFNLPQ